MPLEPGRHVVVFDVNVYLDVAVHLGPPFSWDRFDAGVARASKDPVPHPSAYVVDSLRAVATCTSGRFAGDQPLEVWTNAHIDRLVRGKAMQSTTPDPVTKLSGLGWAEDDAQALVVDLVGGITERSSGGTLGAGHYPDGNPPLDHEDGMVYGACRTLSGDDPLANVYCITRDGGFLRAYREHRLGGHSRVLPPAAFVALARAARARISMRAMRPGPGA